MKKNIQNIHDKSYKDLFSNKEVFLDLIQKMMKVDWADKIQLDDLVLVNKSYITSDYEEKESDIVYKANLNGEEVIFYILLEFQSTIDYRMPLRLFFYINEILRDYAKNDEHKAYDKDIKIPAVIPIVLYNGKKKWDVPLTLKEMTLGGEIFKDYIMDFKYDLFDVNNNYTKEELISNNNITSAIFLLDQKIEVVEFLDRIKAIALFFSNLSEKEKMVLKHWIGNTIEENISDEAKKILEASKEEVETMVANNAYVLTESLQRERREGRQEGRQEGRREGSREEKIKIARKLLDILDIETIALKTGLTIEEVKKLAH